MLTHEQQCDRIINQLMDAVAQVKRIKVGDCGAAMNLASKCRTIPHEGDVFCVPMDSIIAHVLEPETVEITE